jgi:hypothetical protein
MNRYVVLYNAPLSVEQRYVQVTSEEAMKGMQLWIDWAKKIGPALVDPGRPLGNAVRVTKEGLSPTESEIVGMSILQANSRDEVLEMVKDHHQLDWAEGSWILVLEEMPIPELSDVAPH